MKQTFRTKRLSLVFVLLSRAITIVAQDTCAEGLCEKTESDDTYLLCASQNWHTMPSNGYMCVSGLVVPPMVQQTSTQWTSSTGGSNRFIPTATFPMASEQLDSTSCALGACQDSTSQVTSTQTELVSMPQAWKPSQDTYGIRSYKLNGKMASVYDADHSSTFRCDGLEYPSDGYYVAFYTRYNSTLEDEEKSQPAPVNCGQNVSFTNPLTGVSETALVLDRCASCVGVGGQLNDPNTDQILVNGATVDFSRALWNKIYNNAPNNVYDVQYSGKVLQGTP
jgi:hypothetical protein